MDISRLKFPAYVIVVGLVIGFIGDLMLYNQPLGISIPILALLLVIGLVGLASVEGVAIVRANLWLILPTLALAAFSAVRAEPTLRFMNTVGALMLGLLLSNRIANRPHIELNLGQYALAILESSATSLFIPLPLAIKALVQRPKSDAPTDRRPVRGVIIGLLIALPFLFVFTALFASADLIFNNVLKNVLDVIKLPNLVGHAFLTLVLSWLAIGGLAYGLTRVPGAMGIRIQSGPEEAPPAPDGEAQPGVTVRTGKFDIRALLGTVESSVVLFSIDALFAVFVVIQAAALFGGEAFLRSQNLTYSDYARRGFFELLTVSLITMGLILVIDFITRRETPRENSIFLAGSGLMIGMTILILASAFQRMQLYELAYGFTRLRIFPHVFMVWLAILFALFLGTLIMRRVAWFASAALVVCIGFVMTLNILNPDSFIVQQNLARGLVGKEVDAAYLGSLSEDAIPDLMPLAGDPRYKDDIGPWLHSHLNDLEDRKKTAGWGAYHWSIDNAYQLLTQRKAEIQKFDISKIRYSYQD